MRLLFIVALVLAGIPGGLKAQTTSVSTPTPAISDPITLQPGDEIRLVVWREPDMDGEFVIDENGIATLPLLGEIRVTDIPLDSLRTRLLNDYRELMRNPSIQITPLRKVLVLGEVNAPGPYAVSPTETLMGVIALAEGATQAGNPRNIEIVRDGAVLIEQATPGSTLNALQMRSGDQIVVQPRSWLSRNRSFVVSMLLAIPSVVYTITRINL